MVLGKLLTSTGIFIILNFLKETKRETQTICFSSWFTDVREKGPGLKPKL